MDVQAAPRIRSVVPTCVPSRIVPDEEDEESALPEPTENAPLLATRLVSRSMSRSRSRRKRMSSVAPHGNATILLAVLISCPCVSFVLTPSHIIFVSQNLQALVMGLTYCMHLVDIKHSILAQVAVFLPLVLIPDLAKLSTTALVTDAFIFFGLLFNARDLSLLVGVALFSFDSVRMVIPIRKGMREPHKFPKVPTGVILGVLVLFGGAGTLAYLIFGAKIQTVVLVNPDVENKMVFITVGATSVISWWDAADLGKFVAFIGCFACVPLCYVYPAMLHYNPCMDRRWKKAADIAMIVFGLVVAVYTMMQTVQLMLEPNTGGPPVFGICGSDVPLA
ncbi:hypothetical protein B0H12DRAFT_1228676 [Mycena haematopus]|nr:hypothetical protein B0H12DRAFT_1228676 [Mycena haematopus]